MKTEDQLRKRIKNLNQAIESNQVPYHIILPQIQVLEWVLSDD